MNDNIYPCANGINDGKYAYNNLQQYDATWYHRFSKTWHMATESWYMYERDVPAIFGTITPEKGANGATAGRRRALHRARICRVNFLQREISLHNYLSFRSDFLDDKKGQRTGYATKYSENASCGPLDRKTVQIRPGIPIRAGLGQQGL